MPKLYDISGTRKTSYGIVTKILCGSSIQAMKTQLQKDGFNFESQTEIKNPRFKDKKTRY
jgi:hypothetical protein